MSLGIIRQGDLSADGGAHSPGKSSLNYSDNVFVSGKGVVRVGDTYGQSHGSHNHPMGQALVGSPNVFANGRAIHRSGDAINCKDVGGIGSLTVFCN